MPQHPFRAPGARPIAVALVVSAALACESTSSSAARGFSSIDSAGVTIATTAVEAEGLQPVLVADTAPRLRIGAREGAEALLFNFIRDAARLPDGRIAVANGRPSELRLFSASGDYVRQLGGPGRGPGEFTALGDLFARAGDTLMAVNLPGFELFRFSADAGYLDMRRIPPDSLAALLDTLRQVEGMREYFGNGAFVIAALERSVDPWPDDRPTGVLYRPERAAVWISSDLTRSRVIGTFGEIEQARIDLGGGRRSSLVPPGARRRISTVGARGSRLCIAPNHQPEVHCVDEDGSHRIARWTQRDVPVSDSAVEAWARTQREWVARGESFTTPAEMERMLANAVIPSAMAPVSRLVVATDGSVLVAGPDIQQPDGLVRYRVLSPEGRLVGLAVMPPIAIHELGEDYVLGVQRDADGVESVVLYGITRIPARR